MDRTNGDARVYRVELETPECARTIECSGSSYVLDAALRAGVPLPSICRQGRCLTCAGQLIEGEVDQSGADTFFAQDREAGFVLPCRARPLSDLKIRTHQQWEMRAHRLAHRLPAPYA